MFAVVFLILFCMFRLMDHVKEAKKLRVEVWPMVTVVFHVLYCMCYA